MGMYVGNAIVAACEKRAVTLKRPLILFSRPRVARACRRGFSA